MGVIRVEHTENYTIMSNAHLRDKALSLRAMGLMSRMLSLPEDWDYTVAGLAAICKEGRDAVRKALQELEAAGYLVREQGRDSGHFAGNDYTLYEKPWIPEDGGRMLSAPADEPDSPLTKNPSTGNPLTETPSTGNPTELRKEERILTPYSPPEGDQPSGPSRRRSAREPKLTAQWKPERFEAFWRYYPALPDGNGHGRRPKKDRAIAAWDRLRPDDATIDKMALALKRQKESRQWQEGIGIPYASTWLNSRSWEEEYETVEPPAGGPGAGRSDLLWI